jgi:hypothetical protein
MQVAQRGTSASSITASGYYTIDRFQVVLNTLGTWTMDQSTDAPSTFSHSLRLTCTTADPSPGPSDYNIIYYRVESQDLIQLGYGTSLAKDLTISFWVKTNKTGKASFTLRQTDNSSKLYSVPYSINSQDTWEYKTITIPGDTAGLFNKDSGEGLAIQWWLNSGSGYTTGSHGGWKTADESSRNVSNLRVGGATSDYFQITGVQLEVGKNATEFEHRSYGEELALCQRYYQQDNIPDNNVGPWFTVIDGLGSSYYRCTIFLPTPMRIAPSVSWTAAGDIGATYGTQFIDNYAFTPYTNTGSGAIHISGWTATAEL